MELGKDGGCRTCGGVWLDEAGVHERASRELEFTGGTYSERRCPVCDEKMDEPLIFDVPIDRCDGHGMWFDKAELAEVVKRSNDDAWRLFGGARARAASPPPAAIAGIGEDPISALVTAVKSWRQKRPG